MAEQSTSGLGEALGLQTNAQPYSGAPITRGLQMGMQNELRKAAQEAKKAAQDTKGAEEAQKAIVRLGAGKFNPRFAPIAEKIARRFYSNAASFPDRISAMEGATMATGKINNTLKLQQETDDAIKAMAKQGFIMPSKAIEGVNKYSNDKIRESASYSLLYPFYSVDEVEVDEEDRTTIPVASFTSDAPKMRRDLMNVLQAAIDEEVDRAAVQVGGGVGGGKLGTKRVVTPEMIDRAVNKLANIDDFKYTVLNANENDALAKISQKALAEPRLQTDPILAETERTKLAAEYLKEMTENYAKDKYGYTAIPKPKGDGFDQFGDGETIGGSNVVTINVQKLVTYKGGDPNKPVFTTEQETVKAGNRRSFKKVPIQAARSEAYIDMATGERMKGQSLQNVDVANINVYPIATQDFKVGQFEIKKGELIYDKYKKYAESQGYLKYEPKFEGTTTVKDGSYTKTISVLADFDEASGSVVSSQSKDDTPLTIKQIKEAQKEANIKNARLNKGTKKSASVQTSTTSKYQKALQAFEKQFNRKPTAQEAEKIKAKYQ